MKRSSKMQQTDQLNGHESTTATTEAALSKGVDEEVHLAGLRIGRLREKARHWPGKPRPPPGITRSAPPGSAEFPCRGSDANRGNRRAR
jgi:hypothetical protein